MSNTRSAVQTASISLPQDIVNLLPDGQDVRIAFTFYREPNLFPVSQIPTEDVRTIVGSSVISAQVGGISEGTRLQSPIQLVFPLTEASIPTEDENASRRCVFWDFTGKGNIACTGPSKLLLICFYIGSWNTNGCSLTSFNETTNEVTCMCDHLTNFACLVVSVCNSS